MNFTPREFDHAEHGSFLQRQMLREWSFNLDFLRSADFLAEVFFPRKGVSAVYNTGAFELSASERAVTKMYVCLLDRLPDPEGLAYWASLLDAGYTEDAIAVHIFNGGYSRTIYGDIASNADFLTATYWHVLGRAPDAGGAAYWLSQMPDASIAARLSILQHFTAAALGAPVGSWENTFMVDRLAVSEEATAQELAVRGTLASALFSVDCFGDSTTFGYDGTYGTRVGMPMPEFLQLQLNMMFANSIAVNNLGINSTTAGDLLIGTAGHLPFATRMAASPASMVVFNFGLNEAYRADSEDSLHANLSELVRLAQAAGKIVLVSTTNPVWLDVSWEVHVPDMNAATLQVAQDSGVRADDEYAYIQSMTDWMAGLSDGLHPVQDLYETKGIQLAAAIELQLVGVAG